MPHTFVQSKPLFSHYMKVLETRGMVSTLFTRELQDSMLLSAAFALLECVSLYSSLSKANKSSEPKPPAGFSNLTVSEAERAIAGNLCRCTRYRPITDTCKSFCRDIAETRRCAKIGADQVKVHYHTKGMEPPILSVEEAVERSSFFEIPPFLTPKQVGNVSKGMAEADHKIISSKVETGSQHYFYMETQTALAIPDEVNCVTVYVSCQLDENAQVTIAKLLGIPQHNVRIIMRRLGRSFGGKALRAVQVAAACAIAAHKLRRPVRMYLDRQTDMIITGGRHPMKMIYTVGFKANGKITALHVDCFLDAG
ncbi:hypothetical protein AMTR_s00086p00086980 [Amborella trichopoda]|uniref:Aldehyde oxidase/xanthine dehydrogenase first molybdopterin binding domain-containing protein n=1 Tax=Amborella trichopoda TaxID=13333 RepID=W1P4E4_AMBTC|nr:hypothetical protein AMTR_s00086p00086980 [Amborella trichopoda]